MPAPAAAIALAGAPRAEAELAALGFHDGLGARIVCDGRARRAPDHRRAVVAGEPRDQVRARQRAQALADVGVAGCLALGAHQYIDLSRAGAGRDGELGRLGRVGRGLEDAPLLFELGDQFVRLGDQSLGVVGDHDHRVCVEEAVHTAARLDQLAEAAVGVGDRGRGCVRAPAVGVVVVVGEAEEEEVVRVVLDELLGDAGRVLVARAGPGEGRLARNRA